MSAWRGWDEHTFIFIRLDRKWFKMQFDADCEQRHIYIVVKHEYASEKDDIPKTTNRAARKTREDAWDVIQSYTNTIFFAHQNMQLSIIDRCEISNDGFTIFFKDGSIVFNEIDVMILK